MNGYIEREELIGLFQDFARRLAETSAVPPIKLARQIRDEVVEEIAQDLENWDTDLGTIGRIRRHKTGGDCMGRRDGSFSA